METNYSKNQDNDELHSILTGKLMNIGGMLEKESNLLLKHYNLNHQQFSVLFEISKAQPVHQKDIINRLMLGKSHLSKIIKKLHTEKLIITNQWSKDQRSALITISNKGKEVIQKCQEIFFKWKQSRFGALTEKQLTEYITVVEDIQNKLKIHSEDSCL